MDSKQTFRENDSQLNCIEIDHGNYRNDSMVCDDRLISEMRNSFKQVLRQISTGNEINRLRKRKLKYNYNMNHKHRGLALIFNHESFDIYDLKPRKGTQVDRERMFETLHSLDFDVQVYDDLEEFEILDKLKKGNTCNNRMKNSFILCHLVWSVAEMDHSDNDCLVIVFLTHGEQMEFNDDESCNTLLNHDLMSYLYSKNGKYPLQSAWDYFTNESCPSLANKPRIFFIQACQGDKLEKGYKLTLRDTSRLAAAKREFLRTADFSCLPKQDFLVVYSSLPEHASFRSTKEGSWFIQSLCYEIENREPDDDLFTTLTRTMQRVAYLYEYSSPNPRENGRKQMPCVFSRLTKMIVFPRKKKHNTE